MKLIAWFKSPGHSISRCLFRTFLFIEQRLRLVFIYVIFFDWLSYFVFQIELTTELIDLLLRSSFQGTYQYLAGTEFWTEQQDLLPVFFLSSNTFVHYLQWSKLQTQAPSTFMSRSSTSILVFAIIKLMQVIFYPPKWNCMLPRHGSTDKFECKGSRYKGNSALRADFFSFGWPYTNFIRS